MYFLNFLDRNALVNGKLNGLDDDLNLKGTQYNTLVSILFVGYLLGQVPSNMILNRVKPAWFMSGMSTIHGARRKSSDLTDVRFYDGVGYYIDSYVYRKELPRYADSTVLLRCHRSTGMSATLHRLWM